VTDEGISLLTNLKSLSLACHRTITIRAVSGLTNLTRLHLYGNRCFHDADVPKLPHVLSLDLGDICDDFDDPIRDEVSQLTSLTCLSLTRNECTSDLGIRSLINLTSLDLSMNKNITGDEITDVGISGLVNLTALNLASNSKVSTSGISGLTNLTVLVLDSVSHRSKVSDSALLHLTNLTALSLRNNRTYLQYGFHNLEIVEFSHLSKLRTLCLDFNSSVKNSDICGFTSLTYLGLLGNSTITKDIFSSLCNLRAISLFGSYILRKEVPKSIVVSDLVLDFWTY
jgi:hypothetical protein